MWIINMLLRVLTAIPMMILAPRRTVAEDGVFAPVQVGTDCTPSMPISSPQRVQDWTTPEWMCEYSAQVDSNLAENPDFYLTDGDYR